MKKIFKKKNICIYLIYYLLVEIFTKFSISRGLFNYVFELFKLFFESPSIDIFIKSFFVLILTFLLWILAVVLITAPVTISILASKTVDKVHDRQNRDYTTKGNIMYYREKLNNISPVMISFLENLKIEEEKDFVATIMKLQLNKNILIENDQIKIISNNVSNLSSDEKKLFYMISNNNFSRKNINEWKNIIISEAKRNNYIKEKNSATGLFIKRLVLVLIFFLFVFGIYYLFDDVSILMDELEKMGLAENVELMDIVKSDNFDFYLETIFKFGFLLICSVGALAWPIFYVVFVVKYQNENNSLKRTESGEELTNLILGLKNFIHDFSNLDDEKKEALYLWDDFFVYAVLLEENKKIVDDILSIREMKLFDNKNINFK